MIWDALRGALVTRALGIVADLHVAQALTPCTASSARRPVTAIFEETEPGIFRNRHLLDVYAVGWVVRGPHRPGAWLSAAQGFRSDTRVETARHLIVLEAEEQEDPLQPHVYGDERSVVARARHPDDVLAGLFRENHVDLERAIRDDGPGCFLAVAVVIGPDHPARPADRVIVGRSRNLLSRHEDDPEHTASRTWIPLVARAQVAYLGYAAPSEDNSIGVNARTYQSGLDLGRDPSEQGAWTNDAEGKPT